LLKHEEASQQVGVLKLVAMVASLLLLNKVSGSYLGHGEVFWMDDGE
jgi:hypothetical protein